MVKQRTFAFVFIIVLLAPQAAVSMKSTPSCTPSSKSSTTTSNATVTTTNSSKATSVSTSPTSRTSMTISSLTTQTSTNLEDSEKKKPLTLKKPPIRSITYNPSNTQVIAIDAYQEIRYGYLSKPSTPVSPKIFAPQNTSLFLSLSKYNILIISFPQKTACYSYNSSNESLTRLTNSDKTCITKLDDSLIATRNLKHNTLMIIDVTTGNTVNEIKDCLPIINEDTPTLIALPDNKIAIATKSSIKLWDYTTGQQYNQLIFRSARITCITSFANDNLVMGTEDQKTGACRLRLWNYNAKKIDTILESKTVITSLCTNGRLLIGDSDGNVKLVCNNSKNEIETIPVDLTPIDSPVASTILSLF